MERETVDEAKALRFVVAAIAQAYPGPKGREYEAWIEGLSARLTTEQEYAAEGWRTNERHVEQLAAIREAMGGYPDSDLVSLATTLAARERKCEALEAAIRTFLGKPEIAAESAPCDDPDCTICPKYDALRRALLSAAPVQPSEWMRRECPDLAALVDEQTVQRAEGHEEAVND